MGELCLERVANNFFKKIVSFIFLLLILSLIISTFIPPRLADRYFYRGWLGGIPWFILAIGIITCIFSFIKKKELSFFLIYFGFFLVILAGFLNAFLSHEGFIEIKEGEGRDGFWIEDKVFYPLDFSVFLKDFSVEFYPQERKGMRFVKSYKSWVTIRKEGNLVKEAIIAVNRPLKFSGYSFYQYGYDPDMPQQTVFQVVKDPGLPFVYTGYLILLLGTLASFKKIWKI